VTHNLEEQVMGSANDSLAILPVRLAVGGGLTYHGYPKLFSGRGHQNIVSMLKQMGVPFPDAAGWAVGVVEFGGGLALIAGACTRLVSAVVVGEVAINLVAAWARHGFPQPLPGCQRLPGVEDSCFYGTGSLATLLAGGGPCSVDTWWRRRRGGRLR
jgi:putative oxidoreductase